MTLLPWREVYALWLFIVYWLHNLASHILHWMCIWTKSIYSYLGRNFQISLSIKSFLQTAQTSKKLNGGSCLEREAPYFSRYGKLRLWLTADIKDTCVPTAQFSLNILTYLTNGDMNKNAYLCNPVYMTFFSVLYFHKNYKRSLSKQCRMQYLVPQRP